jgi:hypothetical protein
LIKEKSDLDMATVNGLHYADFAVGHGIYGTPYLKFQKTYTLAIEGHGVEMCLIGKDRQEAIEQAYNLAMEDNRVEIWKDGVLVDVYTAGQLL